MKPPLLFLVLLAACAAPEVTQQITASRALLTAIRTDTGPALTAAANAEYRTAEDARIRAGDEVITPPLACDPYAVASIDTIRRTCRPVSLVAPREGTNAHSTTAFLSQLETYVEALEQLASAGDVEAARKQAGALVEAFGAPDPARATAFEDLAVEVRSRRTLIVEGTGFFLDQVRLAGLRRAIRAADPVIQSAVPDAAAYLSQLDPGFEEANAARIRALQAVEDALVSGNRPAHRAAVDRARAAQARFETALGRSAAARLRGFQALHAELTDAVSRPGTLAAVVGLLEQLRALQTAAQGR